MLNQAIIVGRITKDIELKETNDGKKVSNIVLEVKRSFKNEDGIYESDYIHCTLWSGLAITASEHCQKGSIVGIKGRVTTRYIKLNDNNKMPDSEIVVEKITFINSSNNNRKIN